MSDSFDNDLGGKNIDLNNDDKISQDNVSNVNRDSKATSVSSQPSSDKKVNFVEKMINRTNLEQVVAQEVTNQAKEQVYKSWLDRYLCCFNWLKRYFKITSKDFYARVLHSIIPFNSKFYDIISSNPDFYGPFWIYTMFVVLVSSCGALTRTIQGRRDLNFYQEFIPTAALLIYFIGFFVPIFVTLLCKLFGGKINVAPVICVYGYSYTIFLPITIICSIPSQILQWIFLSYAIVSSSSLIIISIGKSITQITKGKKVAIIVIIIIFQLVLFCVLKFYFYKHLNKELDEEQKIEIVNTIVENTVAPVVSNITNTNTTKGK
jgi:hypothetical protein